MKTVHFAILDYDIYCKAWAQDPEATSIEKYVTCKNCLRMLTARSKRVIAGKQEAWTY